MNSSKKLLSICIPTYNRCGSLDLLLNQISDLIKNYDSDLEICISDNNSNDDTSAIIKKWIKIFPINHYKNEKNIGFSRNVDKLLCAATGKWMCIVGDDDLLIPANIEYILNILRSAEPDAWIILPMINKNNPKSSWLSNLAAGNYDALKMKNFVIRKGISHFGFIGCHIIGMSKKRLYQSIPIEYSKDWIHMSYWFVHLCYEGKFIVLKNPLIQINTSAKVQVGYNSVHWLSLWLQRLVNFHNISQHYNFNPVLINFILLREIISFSQFKEFVRFYMENGVDAKKKITAISKSIEPTIKSLILISFIKLIYFVYKFIGYIKYFRPK
jgi:glycosyltransferase involved in cell wall biosynthesis